MMLILRSGFSVVFLMAAALGGCATQSMPEILPVTVMSPSPAPAPPAAAQAPEQTNDPRDGEITRLRQEVADLRAEIGKLNRLIETLQLARTERATEAPAAPKTPVKAAANKAAPAKQAPPKAAADKAATDKTAGTAPKSILPVVEDSIKPTPGGNFGVHLASYRSPEMAGEGWRTLSKTFPTLLPAFTPHVSALVMGGETGKYYRLIAGPLASLDDARKLCQKLASGADFCTPTDLSGEPLTIAGRN